MGTSPPGFDCNYPGLNIDVEVSLPLLSSGSSMLDRASALPFLSLWLIYYPEVELRQYFSLLPAVEYFVGIKVPEILVVCMTIM